MIEGRKKQYNVDWVVPYHVAVDGVDCVSIYTSMHRHDSVATRKYISNNLQVICSDSN